jgi:hypothetical protein
MWDSQIYLFLLLKPLILRSFFVDIHGKMFIIGVHEYLLHRFLSYTIRSLALRHSPVKDGGRISANARQLFQ